MVWLMSEIALHQRCRDAEEAAVPPLQAPFPWFGGKSRVSSIVWDAFGDVANYVEPFFGSGAVLLGRPHSPKIETINDADGFVANFWRAIKSAPDDVAKHADWPVNECDLHARHLWLVENRDAVTARLHGDPGYFDAKLAGWWVWGCCAWIGGGWCSGDGPWGAHIDSEGYRKLVHLGDAGRGINRKRVHLGDAGQGINRKLVHLGDWFASLADRLRRVRVCCGDWTRVIGPTPTTKLGITAVFLDPPYSAEANRDMNCYSVDSGTTAHDVRVWCIANGDNPLMRIALCGYAGEHNALIDAGWRIVEWKARGGYGSQGGGKGRDNSHRERIWFSPHCLSDKQRWLFA